MKKKKRVFKFLASAAAIIFNDKVKQFGEMFMTNTAHACNITSHTDTQPKKIHNIPATTRTRK